MVLAVRFPRYYFSPPPQTLFNHLIVFAGSVAFREQERKKVKTPESTPSPTEGDECSTSERPCPSVERPNYLSVRGCAALLDANNHGSVSTLDNAGGHFSITKGTSEAYSELSERLRIDFSDVTVGQLIGSGAYKSVYRARWNNTNVALISMRRGGRVADARMMQAILSHPNLVQFYRWATDDWGNEHMIVEWVKMGSLDKVLVSDGTRLQMSIKIALCEQVCSAMCQLVSEGILHRDLAARNILVASLDPVHVKVSDFGLAWSDLPRSKRSSEKHVPVRWSPPEVLEKCKWSEKSDVWSFGVTMWEIFSDGKEPYAQLQLSEAFKAIRRHELLPCPAACSVAIYRVMLSCWEKDPERRPAFDKLLSVFKSWRKPNLGSNDPSLQGQMESSGSGGTSGGSPGSGGSGGSGSGGSGGQFQNESGSSGCTRTVKSHRATQATQETPVTVYDKRNSEEADGPAIAESVPDQDQEDEVPQDLATEGLAHQRVEFNSGLPPTDLEQEDLIVTQECNSEPRTCETSDPLEQEELARSISEITSLTGEKEDPDYTGGGSFEQTNGAQHHDMLDVHAQTLWMKTPVWQYGQAGMLPDPLAYARKVSIEKAAVMRGRLESQQEMQAQVRGQVAAEEAEAQKQGKGVGSSSNDENSGTSGNSSSEADKNNSGKPNKLKVRNACNKCRGLAVGMNTCWCNFGSTAADLDDYCISSINGLQLDGGPSDGRKSAKA